MKIENAEHLPAFTDNKNDETTGKNSSEIFHQAVLITYQGPLSKMVSWKSLFIATPCISALSSAW